MIPTQFGLNLSVLICALCTTVLRADDLQDLHLQFVPRTDQEVARIEAIIAPTNDFSRPEQFEENSGGAATVRPTRTNNAFSQPSANISFEKELEFKVGNGLFKKLWVSSPSSTLASDGLGPLYNARSCQRCHLKDGRGHPPENVDDSATSLLIRLSIPDETDMIAEIEGYIATRPDPVYGGQIQDFGIAGHPAEARVRITYTEKTLILSDGEEVSLRKPDVELVDLRYGPLHPDVMISARVAPQMIGLGSLGAVPAADILARADPEDSDGDGISGRANVVMSSADEQPMLGRFGLKAGKASVWEQTAGAFSGDIGISSSLNPQGFGDCTVKQTRCQAAPDGNTRAHDDAEISDVGLELVTYYSANLGVPARRDVGDPEVLQGKQVFYETGCTACHTPKHVTHRLKDQPEQSFQLIWPYTDMLLHDMGRGLADNRPEGRATGQEWRTPPLWGIGLTQQVSGHTYFLHDGRARNLLEAILWHGGEAEAAKQRVVNLPKIDRDALIRFLESL
ncbi:di-heme oxidoredictase family protein [Roseobacter sp.]|uniref:di-heme oxidoreductase family protein n=1 Tax=Roseobacter sp. TaxID=1907202 RepID=UPI00385C2B99